MRGIRPVSVGLLTILATGALLASALTAAPPVAAAEANPTIADQCGFDTTLVLDASGSINSAGATESVRGAATAFLRAMSGTDSTARVVDFATYARESAPSTLVTADTLAPGGVHARALHAYYHPKPPPQPGVSPHQFTRGAVGSESSYRTPRGDSTQYTNWDAALHLTGEAPPELVVFVTDGDPTAVDSDQPGDPFYTGAADPDVRMNMMSGDAQALALSRAVEEADALKRAGSRVLVIGVGGAFSGSDSATRLKAISGEVVVNDATVGTVSTLNDFDVALVRNFDTLTSVLRDVVTQLCSPSLTIRKLAQSSASDAYAPAPGWDFTATPAVQGGTYTWIQPAGAPVGPQTVTTNANGNAQFQWEPVPSSSSSTVTVQETPQTDFASDRYRCEIRGSDGSVTVDEGSIPTGGFSLSLGSDSIVACEVWNSFDFTPGITLTKSDAPAVVRGDGAGTAVTSTFTVTNDGNTDLQMSDIVDDLCSPVTYSDADGTLSPGETWNATCTRQVQHPVSADPISVTNTATVRGTDPHGTHVPGTATGTVEVHTPAIAVEKTGSTTSVDGSGLVTYTYAVTNPGNVPLAVAITDDMCAPVTGPVASGDANTDGLLDPTETWEYSCAATIAEDTHNTVEVTGTPPIGPAVTTTDTWLVNVVHPGLDLTKSASRHTILAGDTVTYSYEVTTGGGDQPITPVAPATRDTWVTDTHCSPVNFDGGDGNGDGILQPSETWEYSCAQALTADTLNRAQIQGTPPGGGVLTDIATDVVRVLTPGIAVEKVALLDTVESGGEAGYLYAVENTGGVGLTGIAESIDDDRCSPVEELYVDPAGTGVLPPGEVWLFGCVTTLEKGPGSEPGTPLPVQNTVGVTAVPTIPAVPGEPQVTGTPLTPTATATVEVVQPGIDIVKSVSDDYVPVGSAVEWTARVTNTGDVPLSSIDVSDDNCSPMTYQTGDTNGDQLLDLTEEWVFTCGDSVPAAILNTATVVGHSPTGTSVTATDTAQVDVYDAQITLTKAVDREIVPNGTTVTWTLEATNPGSDPVSAVAFEDSLCDGVTGPSGDVNTDGNLDPSETWGYTCTSVITDPHINVAVIGGRDPGAQILLAAAAAASMPYDAGINVVKTADRMQARAGDEVTYTYVVTNTGDVPLAGVRDLIVDDRCTDVTYVSGDLDENGLLTGEGDIFETGPPETWEFTCSAVLTETTTNVVTVTGSPVNPQAPTPTTPLGPPVTHQGTVTVVVPAGGTTPPDPGETPTTPTDPTTPTATPPTGGLSNTGFAGALLLWVAATAVAVGLGMVGAATRRRAA